MLRVNLFSEYILYLYSSTSAIYLCSNLLWFPNSIYSLILVISSPVAIEGSEKRCPIPQIYLKATIYKYKNYNHKNWNFFTQPLNVQFSLCCFSLFTAITISNAEILEAYVFWEPTHKTHTCVPGSVWENPTHIRSTLTYRQRSF